MAKCSSGVYSHCFFPSCLSVWSLFFLPHLLLPRSPRISFQVLEAQIITKKTFLGSPHRHATLQGSCKEYSKNQEVCCSSRSSPELGVANQRNASNKLPGSMHANCADTHATFEHRAEPKLSNGGLGPSQGPPSRLGSA